MENTKTLGLSPRLFEVLGYISKGLTNKEIADILSISPFTVKRHVATIIQTLELTNRTEAAIMYNEHISEVTSTLKRNGIAVIPFRTNEETHTKWGKYLCEELSVKVAYNKCFQSISPETMFDFVENSLSPIQVGKELNVSYVLNGTFWTSDNKTRITVNLYNCDTETLIWSSRYDTTQRDFFSVIDDICNQIISSITPELMNHAGATFSNSSEIEQFDAWELSLQGMWKVNLRTKEDNEKARDLFERAIAVSPTFGHAYYGYAIALYNELMEHWCTDTEGKMAQIISFAQKALLYDGGSIGHYAMAVAYMVQKEIKLAVSSLQTAIEMNPSFDRAYILLGQLCALTEEYLLGESYLKEALRLNPRSPHQGMTKAGIALICFCMERYEESMLAAQEMITCKGNSVGSVILQIVSLYYNNQFSEAKALCKQVQNTHSNCTISSCMPFIAMTSPKQQERIIHALRDCNLPN